MAKICNITLAAEIEQYVEKSCFIGYTKPVNTEDEAEQFIKDIRQLQKKATHNVYAYIISNAASSQKSSDDGEPGGSAGMPILILLKQLGLTNLVVVVTRYFSGIKLGTGGLARAYSSTAKLALEQSLIITRYAKELYRLNVDYPHLDQTKYLIEQSGIIQHIAYAEQATLEFALEGEKLAILERQLANFFAHPVYPEFLGSVYI